MFPFSVAVEPSPIQTSVFTLNMLNVLNVRNLHLEFSVIIIIIIIIFSSSFYRELDLTNCLTFPGEMRKVSIKMWSENLKRLFRTLHIYIYIYIYIYMTKFYEGGLGM